MEGKLQLTIRTATRDRQAPIILPPDVTVAELLEDAKNNWSLSSNYEYVLRCERLGAQLAENVTLQQAGVMEGDVLEIQPLADAGYFWK
jgi:hypothetical protein